MTTTTVSPFTPAEAHRLADFKAAYKAAAKHPPLSYRECQRLRFIHWLVLEQRGTRGGR